MKRFISLILTGLLLMGCVSAYAANSPTVHDTSKITVISSPDEIERDEAFELWISTNKEHVEKVNRVIEYLQDARNIAEYFGVADRIAAILGEGKYKMHEMHPVCARNAEVIKSDAVEIALEVASVYDAGEKVAVLIGAYGEEALEWEAFEGVADEDGVIHFEISRACAEAIEQAFGILAILST